MEFERVGVSMTRFFSILAFITVVYSAPAAAQRFDVEGVVTDSLEAGLPGATVVLLEASDSTLVSYGITRDDGAFRLRRAPAGDYQLQVTFVGYEPYYTPVSVTEGNVDVGSIALTTAVSNLDELVVTAEHIPMLIKSDTLEYNAAAFQVRPNANVEELLRRLPGVEVEQDGSIRAQGEQVEQVLVDGKEFFGNDPRIATQNLPADAVDKVQVYDKQSDMAEFTGIDDGEESKTINLALREDSKEGYFGTATGGYGNDVLQSRYQGRASINRFTPGTQMSFIGNWNNVNEQGFSVSEVMGMMGGMQMAVGRGGMAGISLSQNASDGYSITRAGGINFNRDFSAKTSLESSYFLNGIDNNQDRILNQQQLVGSEQSSRSNQASLQDTRTMNHRLNLSLFHKFSEGQDLRLRTNLQAASNDLDNTLNRNVLSAGDILINNSNTLYASGGQNYGGNASLTYRKRLSERGRTLVAEASSSLNDGTVKSDLNALNSFYDNVGNVLSSEEVLQFQSQFNDNFTDRQRLSWTEPLNKGSVLEIHGERRRVREDQNKGIYDLLGGGSILNEALSSELEQTYTYAEGGLNLRLNRGASSFAIGADVQTAELTGNVIDQSVSIDRRFVNVLPSAMFTHEFPGNKNLDVRYRASTREPSMNELQPFADNSDPLNIYTGNPNLKPEYQHTGTVHFMLFDQFSFTNFFGYVQGQYTNDKIARSRSIDEQLRQTTTPVNVSRDWLLAGSLNFGTPIRPLGAKVNLSTQTMYNDGIEWINEQENEARVLRQSIDLRLENRNKEVIDVRAGARYTFNAAHYSLNPSLDRNYVNRTFYGEFNYYLGDAWRFTTGLDYRLFDDEVFGTGTDVPLWRAEIARTFLDQKAEVQLVGLDLLDRNLGINYTNTGNYIQEEQINSLGRYVMLNFVYNLSGIGRNDADVHVVGH